MLAVYTSTNEVLVCENKDRKKLEQEYFVESPYARDPFDYNVELVEGTVAIGNTMKSSADRSIEPVKFMLPDLNQE